MRNTKRLVCCKFFLGKPEFIGGASILKAIVTGGCGFIGSHLVDALMSMGYEVIVIDNLSNGSKANVERWLGHPKFRLVESDLKKYSSSWVDCFRGVDVVFHFAANPEVRVSVANPRVHFEENIQATFNVLEACRVHHVPYLVFASSSTVYGDAKVIPTPEDYHPLEPISVYGACKLACENLIISYSKLYGIRSLILRYANIIGPRSNHGVIIDFINKLRKDPTKLEILGDGTQRKSYLYISDCINATLHLFNTFTKEDKEYDIYNVGNEDWVTVKEIADIIVKEMGLENVKYEFKPATPDGRGWPGDVKLMLLDITKLKTTGWKPQLTSRDTIKASIISYLITIL